MCTIDPSAEALPVCEREGAEEAGRIPDEHARTNLCRGTHIPPRRHASRDENGGHVMMGEGGGWRRELRSTFWEMGDVCVTTDGVHDNGVTCQETKRGKKTPNGSNT